MDREAWSAAIHGVAKSRTWLSDWTELNRIYQLFYLFMKCILFLNNSPFVIPKAGWLINSICCWYTLVKLINLVCVCLLSCFSHVQLFVTPWTVAHQAPLSMRFSRQEYWSELPCPTPGDLPNPGIKPKSLMSPALADRFFTTCATTCEALLVS